MRVRPGTSDLHGSAPDCSLVVLLADVQRDEGASHVYVRGLGRWLGPGTPLPALTQLS
jgi:hypothetical protein